MNGPLINTLYFSYLVVDKYIYQASRIETYRNKRRAKRGGWKRSPKQLSKNTRLLDRQE